MDIQPPVPNIPTVEGGGGGDGGGGSDGGDGGGGSDGGDGGGGSGGSANVDGEVMVCIELTRGNLQRNVTVAVSTFSSTTSTGNRHLLL